MSPVSPPPPHTHTVFMALWILSRTTRQGELVPEETFTQSPLTPIMVINHPFSASSIYYDPWHPPCSIHAPDNLFPQSLSQFSLVYSWPGTRHFILHFFTQSLSSSCNTCPYHRNLFCCSTEIMSFNPSLSVNASLGILSYSFMPHIHLTILSSAH